MTKEIKIGELLNINLFKNYIQQRKILAAHHLDLGLSIYRLNPTIPVAQYAIDARLHVNGMIADDNDVVIRRGLPIAVPYGSMAAREAEGSCSFYEVFEGVEGIFLTSYYDPILGMCLCEFDGFSTPLSNYATELLYTQNAVWAVSKDAQDPFYTHIFKITGADLAQIYNEGRTFCNGQDRVELVYFAKITNTNGWPSFNIPESGPGPRWKGPKLTSLGKFYAKSSNNRPSGDKDLEEFHLYEALANLDNGEDKYVTINVKYSDVSSSGIGSFNFIKVPCTYMSPMNEKLVLLRTDRVNTNTVFDALKNGASKQQILDAAGPEYSNWVENLVDDLQLKHRELRAEVWREFWDLMNQLAEAGFVVDYDRELNKFNISKEARSEMVKLIKPKHSNIRMMLFDILDGRNLIYNVWDKVRPVPFANAQKNPLAEFLDGVEKVEV